MSEATCYKKLRWLATKGCLKVLDSFRRGTEARVRTPHDLPGVIPQPIPTPEVRLEDLDFSSHASHRKLILHREGRRCFYCLRRLTSDNYVIEHVSSRPRGDNSYRKVVAACRECNNRKADREAAEYLRDRYRGGFLSHDEFDERLAALVRLR